MAVKINGLFLGLRSLWANQACSNSQKLFSRQMLLQTKVTVRHHNFDGEAYSKTNISMMNEEDETHTYISAYSRFGFRLSSGFRVYGPCAVFPRAVLSWNVPSADKITPESLSLFCMLEPKPDLLIIGKGNWDAQVNKDIIRYLRSKKINVEIVPTEQACSTFNFLNAERRVVVAALIPPTELEESPDFIDMEKAGIDNVLEVESKSDRDIRENIQKLERGEISLFTFKKRTDFKEHKEQRIKPPELQEKESSSKDEGDDLSQTDKKKDS